jgi:hypothetical protein
LPDPISLSGPGTYLHNSALPFLHIGPKVYIPGTVVYRLTKIMLGKGVKQLKGIHDLPSVRDASRKHLDDNFGGFS